MTVIQTINLFIALLSVSGVFAAIYWIQERINIHSQYRLKFLKTHLLVVWLLTIASIVVLLSNAGVIIGEFLPYVSSLKKMSSDQAAYLLPQKSISLPIETVLVGNYFLGTMWFLSRFTSSYLKMRKMLLDSSAFSLGGKSLRLVELHSPPFSFGLLNPHIFIPRFFLERHSEVEVMTIIAHEETHIKNADPQWKVFSLFTQSLLFFSPAVWYLHRKLDLEMELECDRMTMADSHLSMKEYGELLIDTVISLRKNQSLFMYMSQTNLKRRIQAMKEKTSVKPMINLILGSVALMFSVAAFGVASNVSKLKGLIQVDTKIYIGNKLVSSPKFVMHPDDPTTIRTKSNDGTDEMNMKIVASTAVGTPIPDGIELNIDWDYTKDGRHFEASPRIVTENGEQATVEIGSANQETVKLVVTAERI